MFNQEKFKKAYTEPRRRIVFNNFLGGLAWGFGTVVGATVIIGMLGLFVARTRNVPFLGEITRIVIEEITKGRETLEEEFRNNSSKSSSRSSRSSSSSKPDSFPR